MAKLKLDSKRVAAIVIGVIMLGSTFAFALLNIFSSPEQQVKVPEERILNYRMKRELGELLLQNGYTVVEYLYSENCLPCLEVKNILEEATNNAENQMFLQEIVSNNTTEVPRIVIANAYTQTAKIFENPTVENVTKEVCSALTSPTVWCLGGV